MAAPRIAEIEDIFVEDSESPTGWMRGGFYYHYVNSRYSCSEARYAQRKVRFFDQNGSVHEVERDSRIEPLDVYHSQYGIAVSDEHDCFFISC